MAPSKLTIAIAFLLLAQVSTAASIDPAKLPATGKVDERFQSFNIEMVEVTGGRFWKPYSEQKKSPAEQGSNAPAGMDPSLYEYRPPIDLSNPRLRKLAAALAPAYIRVSGTWANTSYFHNSEEPAPSKAPQGFNGVLTRAEWKGVVDFSRAVDAKIISSFATSAGTRDASGVWTPDQANQFLAYTKSIGGSIAAAEFMNEPTFAEMGGAPKGYNATSYASDMKVFHNFIRKTDPNMIILGPGSVGEGYSLGPTSAMRLLKTDDLLKATGPNQMDVFSYHFYGAVSQRCASIRAASGASPETALSQEFLARTVGTEEFYAALRDRFEPGKPIWITETAQSACGGDRWAATFLDSFRYLDQMGRMAQRGVQVIAHNTLAASDYGLLDEKNYTPRPNYWSALLWHKLMGTTVLNPGATTDELVHIYAQCLKSNLGGVALLAINTDQSAEHKIAIQKNSMRYTLSARNLQDQQIQLNGHDLALGPSDSLPPFEPVAASKGEVKLAPATITFFAIPNANNQSCK